MVKGIHYDTQTSDNQGGRTDFIVHMPHRRDIILDSKVSLVALIEAQDTTDDAQRSAHLDRHARHMQEHADSLAGKEYWSQLPDSADFVVMVVPEFALPPAVERRPNLIDRALQNNVVISTHSTLVALLKTVAMGWQERQLADEAQEIGTLGRELHDRLEVFATHYADIGTALDRAVNRYNRGVGSLESRVLTQARRFPELGVQTTKEIPETQPVESSTRAMRSAQSMLPEEDS
ncbi:MAG: DNA recombination protein RmuC [Chloroflexi bacterium]|nr:DNA recombination protein RmuC [Chloroflexota bacterium]